MTRASDKPASNAPGVDETTTSCRAIVGEFLSQWRQGTRPDVAAFLPPAGAPQRREVLLALIAADVACRIEAGEPARLEEYVGRFEELPTSADLPCELIIEEFTARQRQGEHVQLSEYAARFPEQFADLCAALPTEDRTTSGGTSEQRDSEFSPGTVLGDFQIVRLLGQGSHARVYLARQLSLDRRVALKVGRDTGSEGQALARLDDPNIVPIYSEHIEAGQKMLAMRYVPGRTLAEWLTERGTIDRRRWRGRDLLTWLAVGDHESDGARATPHVENLASQRFAPAMCRIFLDLARALEHAHAQGILHRDIKPANILIDREGRALLMDFSVAARMAQIDTQEAARLGGTLPYMAPEHLQALSPQFSGSAEAVDQRSDVYSMGVVLFEVLTGNHPFQLSSETSGNPAVVNQLLAERLRGPGELTERMPGTTPGLRSIVEKCLAPRPEDRYQSASDLADDLQRYVENRPLKVAADRSARERLQKWVRRHPRVVTAGATVGVLAIVLIAVLGGRDLHRQNLVGRNLAEAARMLDAGDTPAALDKLQEARALLSQGNMVLPTFITGDRMRRAESRYRALSGDVAAREWDRFQELANANRLSALSLSDAPQNANDNALDVYQVLDRADWEQLPQYRSLEADQRIAVSDDVTELLVLRIADSLMRSDDAAPTAASPRRLELNTTVNRVPVIHRENRVVQLVEGALRATPPAVPSTAELTAAAEGEFDCYLAGIITVRRGDLDDALSLFDESIDRRGPRAPLRFWACFMHAYCAERLGRHLEAIAGYGICIGLRDDFSWPYHNLALTFAKDGQFDLAVENFQRAIALEPRLGSAHGNLGVALFELGRYTDARDEFDRAIEFDYRPATVYMNRAAARAALDDNDGARVDLEQALDIDPDLAEARENLKRLGGDR